MSMSKTIIANSREPLPLVRSRVRLRLALIKLALLFALLIVLCIQAFAHDATRPELDGWYHDLHAQNGAWCCEGKEATHLADTDWESKDGHYRVRIDGNWIDVPDGAVITQPNRDGRTLVWPFYINGERAGVRCFLPGSMT